MSEKILSAEESARQVLEWGKPPPGRRRDPRLDILAQGFVEMRAERDAARVETQRWVQIARAALAAVKAQKPTDPVKT